MKRKREYQVKSFTRKIGKRKFMAAGYHRTKKQAKKLAEQLRKQGYPTRVLKFSGKYPYGVYAYTGRKR